MTANAYSSLGAYMAWLVAAIALSPNLAITQGTAPRGDVVERVVDSRTYGRNRRVWVYTPRGYPGVCGDGCPLVVAFDGDEYLDSIPLPRILDSLTDAK